MSTTFHPYRRKVVGFYRPYIPGEDMTGISVGDVDRVNGSPKAGDMIGRDPQDHSDQWLVNKTYFETNFEPTGTVK